MNRFVKFRHLTLFEFGGFPVSCLLITPLKSSYDHLHCALNNFSSDLKFVQRKSEVMFQIDLNFTRRWWWESRAIFCSFSGKVTVHKPKGFVLGCQSCNITAQRGWGKKFSRNDLNLEVWQRNIWHICNEKVFWSHEHRGLAHISTDVQNRTSTERFKNSSHAENSPGAYRKTLNQI